MSTTHNKDSDTIAPPLQPDSGQPAPPPSRRSERIVAACVALVFAIAALYFAVTFFKSYLRYADLRDNGVVTAWVGDRREEIRNSGRFGRQHGYYLTFIFTVANREYSVEQKLDEDTYRSFTRYVPPQVQILYNPKNPKHAVLEGTNQSNDGALLTALGCSIGSIAFFVMTRAGNQQKRTYSLPLPE